MASSENFDLVVIGCGPAGEKAGAQAAYFGKRVAVIERAEHMGGSCINTGTVPSKTLRESGLHEGSLFVRWQKLPQPLGGADAAVHEVKLIKLADLGTALPNDVQRVSVEQQKHQLDERTATYLRRFAER